MQRPYSTKPSAVRMRRKRLKDQKLQQLLMLQQAPAPKQITWHCGCGTSILVYEDGAAQFDAWTAHRRACLFSREAFPVLLERRTAEAK